MSWYEGEDAYEKRIDALCAWAGQTSSTVDWEYLALFLARQLLPGMQEGEASTAGRPRANREFSYGLSSTLTRAEGEWLVQAVQELQIAAERTGSKLTVLQACSRLKALPSVTTKSKAVATKTVATLRRQYYEQRKLLVTRKKIEASRRQG
ncbi:hypothetical protein EPO44_14205 [bacterium]|nr:MAG: hypothetical protein EPO44_14205 [bacterium]